MRGREAAPALTFGKEPFGSAAGGRRMPGGWAMSLTMGREFDADGLTSAVWFPGASAGLWQRHHSQRYGKKVVFVNSNDKL